MIITTADQKKPEVLCIDDDPQTLSDMGWALKKEFDVVGVENGDKGIKLVKRDPNRFCIIFIDNDMGPSNDSGTKVVEKLKKITRTPLAMVTGAEGREVVIAALKAGANDFILKDGHYLPNLFLHVHKAIKNREENDRDPITGFLRPELFDSHLDTSIKYAAKNRQKLAVIIITVGEDKEISVIHNIHDLLMAGVAEMLREKNIVVSPNLVFKSRGDEISIILPNIKSKEAAAEMASRILNYFREPLTVGDKKCHIEHVIKMGVYPDYGLTAQELLAMSKRVSWNHEEVEPSDWLSYFSEMNSAVERINRLREDVKKDKSFITLFQPRVCVYCVAGENNGKFIGVEVSAGWQDGDEIINQEKLTFLAGSSAGIMGSINDFVLEEAGKGIKELRNASNNFGHISTVVVKLTPHMLKGKMLKTLPKYIEEKFKRVKMNAFFLELEIPEEAIEQGGEMVIKVMQALRELEVSLTLSNFGKTPDTWRILQNAPINKIKIPAHLVHDLEGGSKSNSLAIVRSIIAMAKALKIKTVAEEVKTKGELETLKILYCDEASGPAIYPPVVLPEVIKFLKAREH